MVRRPRRTRGHERHKGEQRQSIKSRIIVLLLVPLISLAGLWVYGVGLTIGDTLSVNLLAKVEASVHQQTGVLFDALQEERRASMVYLGSEGRAAGDILGRLRQETNQAASGLAGLVDDEVLSDVNPAERKWLDELQRRLTTLESLRREIDAGSVSRPGAEARYTVVIEACLGVFTMMTTDTNSHYGFYHQTMVDLQRAREALAQEDALLAGVLAVGQLATGEYETLVRRIGAQRALFADAEAGIHDQDIRLLYRRTVETDAFQRLRGVEDVVASRGRDLGPLPVTAKSWDATRTQVMRDLRRLEGTVYDSLVAHATPVVIRIIANLVIMVLLGVIITAIAVYLWLRIGRRVIRQLNALKETALQLAHERLPSVVEQLRRGERVDVTTEAPPLEFGPDELGDVGRAFNVVQQTAVQAAVDQAAMRTGVNAVFLNLARRTQGLVHRQLTLLDAMERRTSDPEELEQLFAVDHLATRMRRHAEDLVILSGASPGRQWRIPVPLVDVVRSAVGEVENYTRVTILPMPEAALAGRVVADVIHLLAELIENATSFSPPHAKVQVGGSLVASGFAVEVEDRGLGMSQEDLDRYNDRLAHPPEFNLADTARLGLFVVGRLSQRHGIKVHLRPSPYGGTTAIVLIPGSLMVTPEPVEPAASSATAPSPAAVQPQLPRPVGALVAASSRPAVRGSEPYTPAPDGDDPGLPRRIRQANLAAPLREPNRAPVPGELKEVVPSGRSPEELRSMMTTFQRDSARGRFDAERAGDAVEAPGLRTTPDGRKEDG